MKTRLQIILLLLLLFMAELLQAQAVLYPQHFPLSEVTLLDSPFKTAMEQRIDYIVRVMTGCQEVFDNNDSGLKGFIGRQPMNTVLQVLYTNGDIALRGNGNCVVPWYCQHKILAGRRRSMPQRGINIVCCPDGTVQKLIVP